VHSNASIVTLIRLTTPRFGSSLNVHPHYHLVVLDGVFSKADNSEIAFHEGHDLTPDRIAQVREFPDPQGNFVWLPIGGRTDSVAHALEQRGVVVRPFSGEGIRVTIGTPEENDRFLATYPDVAG
jgi:hypothetical protein